MKAITQRDNFGCGIACVAFICGVNYSSAKKRYFNREKARTQGYLCKELVAALSFLNRKYDYRYIKRKTSYKENDIVFIKRSERYPSGHYLVKAKSGWMDPWINFNANRPEVREAISGFRKRLPGTPIYLISQVS